MLRSITIFLCIAFAGKIFAQEAVKKINGAVANDKSMAVAGATVSLLKAADTTQAAITVTGSNGKFIIDHVPNGRYLLTVTAIGLKQAGSISITVDDAHNDVTVPVIVLTSTVNNTLAAVTVKTNRKMVEQEIDKTVVNVDAMLTGATSNTLEVLQKTPGVIVSATGDISLNGRSGVLLLIDGRPTYMAAQDLAAYLKSLPGAILDKIELMDNPPARYDAAGNAIINIRLKKNRAGGFTGNISAGYTQGRYAKHNDALNINYNIKKLNFFANAGYNYENNYTRDVYDRTFFNTLGSTTSTIGIVSTQVYNPRTININAGADYAATANTTYGIMLNINSGRRPGLLNYTSNNYTTANQIDTVGSGYTNGLDKRTNIGTNFNMVHKFGKTGRELSADVNYLHYTPHSNQAQQTTTTNAAGTFVNEENFLYVLPTTSAIYTFKADYSHPLKNKAKFEAGIKTSVVDNSNIADYYTIKNNDTTVDNTRSNTFNYKENINAVYINGQKNWARWGLQFGLRAENTNATGQQLGNAAVPASHFSKNYTQLFPSLFASYKLDSAGNNTLVFSLTRRINRPNYQLLNPFLFLKDQYTYTQGNTTLIPQYQYRYEVRYSYKQYLRIGLSYNRFTNLIFQTTQTVNNIFITQPNNIGLGYMLLLNTGATVSPVNGWRLLTDVLLSHIGLNGTASGNTLNQNTYVARINVFNQLQFNNGWSAELGAYYASTDLNGQTITSGMVRANAAIQKKFWKDKASIRLSIDDIFNSWVYHYHSFGLKQAQYYQTSEADTRRVGIAFTYRFGNSDFSRKSKHVNNASDEEKDRLQ
jgi:hypothetical protein